jgi:uncharacterized protein
MAGQITLRFHDELNDFLPPERRGIAFVHRFREAGSIKDLVESLGVPHTEIDVILVNGRSVDFRYRVQDGDMAEILPHHASMQLAPLHLLRPPLPHPVRFVLDTHLGRLAAYLRLLGFDTLYRNDSDDPTLARISADERRILLTCDRGLLMRRQIVYGCYVRARQPRAQLLEVVTRLRLFDSLAPFTRCMHCNGPLRTISKQEALEHLPPRTREYYDEFRQCGHCKKVYWKGSHFLRLQQLIETIRNRD